MSDPFIPDPAQPQPPVLLPRRPPATVTLAALLMLVGAALGLIEGVALLVAAGTVPGAFRDNARGINVAANDVNTVADLIRGAFISAGVVSVLLAVAIGLLALGVRNGSNGARITTLILIVAAFCCGLGVSSYTALGRSANWTVSVSNPSEELARQVGQAYSDAMPPTLVGTTGGLTDLQSLGYIAVAVLLLVPVSNAYFRRRAPAAPPPPGPPSIM
jgi:hypothetical protein